MRRCELAVSGLGGSAVTVSYGVQLAVDRPDLAILDFAMPGMNGAEVAREARRLHPGLPVLFASGYADTDALQEALGNDAPLLRKPFQVSELAGLVAKSIAPGSG